MNRIINMYRPITTTPFTDNDTYCEILPCEALRPYIRCFWGTKKPLSAQTDADSSGIVIPDTCMDIIFDINYTENNYSGFFCTVDEHSYHTGGAIIADTTATFAIRFYAWTAILFSEEDFTGRKNSAFAVEEFFSKLKAELVPLLFDVPTLDGKIAVTEKILLKKLCTNRINNNLMKQSIICLKQTEEQKSPIYARIPPFPSGSLYAFSIIIWVFRPKLFLRFSDISFYGRKLHYRPASIFLTL